MYERVKYNFVSLITFLIIFHFSKRFSSLEQIIMIIITIMTAIRPMKFMISMVY